MTLNEELEAAKEQLGRPGMTAGEMATLLPEHLRSLYWRQKLDEYFTREADS
jgi:hypothetical protein